MNLAKKKSKDLKKHLTIKKTSCEELVLQTY